MSNIINFFDYNKPTKKTPKIWKKLPMPETELMPYTIILRICQYVNGVPTWSYSFPQYDEILKWNEIKPDDYTLWAYMDDIENLIADYENPRIG